MANPEHLQILHQGVGIWNSWRQSDSRIKPDLSGLDLNNQDLNHIDFTGSDLSGMNLAGAGMIGAKLVNCDLSHSLLLGTSLPWADLRSTNLTGADLSLANLASAVLWNTEMRGTNLTGAMFGWTIVGNVDLSEVIGLGTLRHIGPSSIGEDTLYKSQGKIPEGFLRSCGVQENTVTYLHALVQKPIDFQSAYISAAPDDNQFAHALYNNLKQNGVSVWFSQMDLQIGDLLRDTIQEAIRLHDRLIVVLSENSLNSVWVESEVESAFEKERNENRTVLFPVRLDDHVMQTDKAWAAEIRRTRHIGDFRRWREPEEYQKAFERLVRDLQKTNPEV